MLETRRFCLRTTLSLAAFVAGAALYPQRAVARTDAAPPNIAVPNTATPNTATPSPAAPDAAPRVAATPTSDGLCHADPRRGSSTLTYLACSLRDNLPPLQPATVVVSRPLSQGSPEGARVFAERFTLLLSSALGVQNGGAVFGPVPQSNAPVLLVEPQLSGNLVQVNATLIGKRASVWARLRGETHQVLAHAFSSSPLDVELQSYLPKVPLVRPSLHTYVAPLRQINAIACGDIDGDGALEVAVANRQDVALGTLTEAGFVPRKVTALGTLSEIAVVPLREPLAALSFNGEALELSTTDRQHWLQLSKELTPIAKSPSQLGLGPGLCTARTLLTPEAKPFPCQTPPKLSDATAPTLDRAVAMTRPNAKTPVLAWRDATSAVVSVQTARHTFTLPDRGAQLALGDLDHDGALEVVTTSRTWLRAEDHLWVHSLPEAGTEAVAIWDFPVPTGVDAVTICPAESAAPSAILFASNDQIGVIQ